MNTSNHFSLGILVLVAMSILGYFTIGESDYSLFGEVQQIVVQFPEADGLREGDSVLVAGVRWGKVTTITYHPEETDLKRRITVLLSLDAPVEIRTGHAIEIRDATLLGGKRLTIDPGSPDGEIIPIETVFLGSLQLNVIEAAGELLTDNSEAFTESLDGIRNLVNGVQEGKGTVGKFFSDEEFAEEIDRAVTGFADTGDNLR
ncbi:MAG: phospholipid/cholesterol/gamma-HCH transport system substrate-binding protein, partial [Candidatus Paceibacteria bacterium]